MDRKPTYEELEQKVKELEQQVFERKLAEEGITQVKNELERTFNAVPDLITILDTGYRIVRVNEAMAERLGLRPDEAVGLTCYEHVHGTKEPPSFCPHSKLLATGQRYLEEIHEERLGGDFLVSVSPLHDAESRVVGCVHIARDITERKKTEQALRESEETYRNLVRLSPDPIVIIQDGHHKLFSSAFTRLFGYTQQDLDNGLDVLDLIQEDYNEAVLMRLKDRFAGKEVPKILRVDMIAKNGKIIPCESSGVLIQYGGQPAILVIIRDITERKEIEEKMIIFQKFAEASEQGLGMADLTGDITYVNPALCRQLGEKKPEDAVGKNVRLYYPEDHRKKLENESLPMVMEKGHWTGELDLLSIQGKITHTIQSIFLIRDKTEKPFCTANVITDITEHKQLDKVLMHREKLKTLGAIAGEVAHEIRNPLTSIGGFAQRLKQKYPDSHECDIILNETQRLENILSRIRNYLEPVEIYPKECAINAIITSCVHLLSPETDSRQVTCALDLSTDLAAVYVDPGILSQIFINLIRNATEAMEEGGTLFIKTFENDQDLHIEFKNQVSDSKYEDPETLFMPFAEGGKNIGLPLCYRLLKDMGGLLSFVQEQDFIRFTVSLPKTVKPDPLFLHEPLGLTQK
ncbi:MAG: PAS domain S-box protein [Deltaproteobacteria bacterium]|nr:PAS domain S-box protein [Deltaproteobacteria bacterium]